jgi:S-adenosylmethionine synthetase
VVDSEGVAMYASDNTVPMANDVDQGVGYYPMDSLGTLLGFAHLD